MGFTQAVSRGVDFRGAVRVLRRLRCDTLPPTTRVLEDFHVGEGLDVCFLEPCDDRILQLRGYRMYVSKADPSSSCLCISRTSFHQQPHHVTPPHNTTPQHNNITTITIITITTTKNNKNNNCNNNDVDDDNDLSWEPLVISVLITAGFGTLVGHDLTPRPREFLGRILQ